jgi:DNA modification methylase
MKVIQSTKIKLSDIEINRGQIPGLPANPRFIIDEKFEKLKQSIQENPDMLPLRELLVYRHGAKYVIIGGNMRYRAMKELGYKETICKIIPAGTPVEALKAYTIKDNAGFGEWDFEQLANDWDLDQIESWGVDIPDVDLDPEPEEAEEDNFDVESNMPKNPVSKIGDIYRLGRHRLVCGDATIAEHLDALMDGKSADAYITDPPYNVDYVGKTKDALKIDNDKMGDSQFQEFLAAAFTQADRVMKKGASYYIWHADIEGYNFRTAALRVGWQLRQTLIWVKNTLVMGRQDYQSKHEPCLYGWKDGAAHYFTTDRTQVTVQREDFDIDKLSKDDMRELLRDILHNIPSTIIEEDKPLRSAEHPTMKPVKLIGRIMKNSTRLTDIVLDNFGGSGTTIIAAEQLGRTCYMMELDPAYCDVIIKRWEELTQESAEYLGNFLEDKNSSENKR